MSDLARHGEWSPQPFRVESLDYPGPAGVGSRYRTAGLKGAREGAMRTNDVVVTEHVPPTRFAFAATERAGTVPAPLKYVHNGRRHEGGTDE